MERRIGYRLLSILLTLVLALELVPGSVWAAEDGSTDSSGAAETGIEVAEGEASETVLGEVDGLRAESQKHFRMADGSFLAVDYGMPVHFSSGLDEDGEPIWEEIDNTLTKMQGASTFADTDAANSENTDIYIAENGGVIKEYAAMLLYGETMFTAMHEDYGVGISVLPQTTTSVSEETEPTVPEADETMPEETEESGAESTTPATDETTPEETEESATEPTVPEEPEAVDETEASTDEAAMFAAEDMTSAVENLFAADGAAEEATQTTDETAPSQETTVPTEPAEQTAGIPAIVTNPGADSLALLSANAEEETPSLEEQITPSRLRSSVLYEEVFPGVDLFYENYSYDTKETILVKAPLESYSFRFRLDLQELTPVMQEDGSIFLVNEEEAAAYLIPAPYMVDGNGAYSEAAFYTLTETEAGWLLTVTADAAWMNAPERAFPVAIDPTLIDYTTAQNFTGVICNQNNHTVSATTNLACGYHPDHGQMEIYYKLTDLPKIPAGHTLVRAQAGFKQNDFRSGTNSTGGKMVLYMSAITSNATFSSMTWANRPSHGPALDFVNASYSTLGMLYWDITPAAKSWYDGGNNYGLVMTSNSDANSKNRAWFSYYDKVSLVVSYRSTNGIEDYYTYQTAGVGNAGTAYFSDFSGQLTLCKQLVTYASTVNPVSLDLVYNSSYAARFGETNYDVGGWLGLGMHVGAGVQLSVMQKVEKVELQNDGVSGKKTTYLKYTDGDGTIHYFAKDPSKNDSYYYDEDGLGLKINEYQTGCYKISDDKDNEMYFVNGLLTTITDSNDNEIQIHYTHSDGTSASNGYPNASGDRISKIVQKNNGGSAITVATFGYSSDNWLKTVTDAAGNVYTLTYSSGKLSQISRGSTVIAQYGATSTRTSYAYDAEAQYGVAFTYDGGKIGSYYEITSASTAAKPGAIVGVSHLANGQTCYRDYGRDRVKGKSTDGKCDDILTYYTFDYAGRTVNAYTTDVTGQILGASNAVYSGSGSTDKTNNRTLRTASIGVGGMNLLRDFGFDRPEVFWTYQGANGDGTHILSKEENPRTGAKACKGWIQQGKTATIAAYRDTDWLQPGTYTLSAYVNTAQCANFPGEGVYLQVSGNGVSAKSEAVNYQTSTAVDGGWVRLSVTFTVETAGKYTVGVYNSGAGPYFFADDFQLEKNNAPSNLNLLENGSMQYWNHGWTMGSLASFVTGCGVHSLSNEACSIKINGDAYTESCAYQDVPIYQTGQTYVLSGWAKADSVPDNVTTATGDDAAAKDKQKQFGLRAILTYADNTTEYHYVPFNPDVQDWQYTSLAIVPKKANTQVKTIRVVCAYERNCNTTYFDNISLVREAAQTMKYDKDGNLVSVKTTGNAEETSTYSGGNLIKSVTGGSGTFEYTYDGKHNVTSVTNGLQKEAITYDTAGNATGFTLSKKDGTGSKITASSAYSGDKNRVSSVTDARGNTTSYEYGGNFSSMTAAPTKTVNANGTEVYTAYDADKGRVDKTWISNVVALENVYNDRGLLESLGRGGYTPDGARQAQSYRFTYDTFGNTTAISVGDRQLASYDYAPKNGLLSRQNYGNGAYTAFSYDDLGRATKTETSSGDVYDYVYTGDGQLYSLRDNNGTSSAADDVFYRYQYDSLGRLIHSVQSQGGKTQLRGSYQYDDSNRVKSFGYSIPGLIDNAAQTYYYNSNANDSVPDGALTSMALFSNAWLSYSYDDLGRLKQRKVGNILQENYTYLAGSGTNTTTTLVSGLEVKDITGSTRLKSYAYAYDKLGNITQIKDVITNHTINYTYDAQGQLLSHNNPGDTRTEYTYDTYGNIRSKNTYTPFNDLWDGYTYTYGDGQWKDLLTGLTVTHNGKSTSGAFTYDQIGNPLTYFNGSNWTFTWRNGRQLATAKTGTKTTKYEYNADGLRTRKVNADGTYADYYWVGSTLLAEVQYKANGAFTRTLMFLHDEKGAIIGVSVKNAGDARFTHYYYAKNLQGDVVAIYRSDYNSTSQTYYPTLVASYEYDPWGKVTSVKGSSGAILSLEAYPNHIAHVNPIRYRGYYYDNETGFYYLQSRYYDPAISRFINADSYGSTGQGFLGTNMFAYCNNNPVNHIDPSGCISITVPASAPGWSAILEALAGVGAYANPALGLFGIAFFARRTVDISEVKIPKFLIQATEKISTGEPETPNISYPGNDPQQAPEGTSWRGNGTPGSGKGSYYNPETGESWHPDLNHEEPIGPHWDYDFRGSGTNGWRVFPDGSVVQKPEAYTRHKMATRKHVKNTHKYGITMQRM